MHNNTLYVIQVNVYRTNKYEMILKNFVFFTDSLPVLRDSPIAY